MKIFKIENGHFMTKDIDGSLESMQAEVGGLLTLAPHYPQLTDMGIDIYADDEGLLKENPVVSLVVLDYGGTDIEAVLVGNLIFTGFDDEGNTVGLTEKQLDYIYEHLRRVTYGSSEDYVTHEAFTFIF